MAEVELEELSSAKEKENVTKEKDNDDNVNASTKKDADDPQESDKKAVAPLDVSRKSDNEGSAADEGTADPTLASPDDPDDQEDTNFISKSLFLFAPEHPLRALCIKIVTNRWWNRFILLVIIVNSAFLAANDPLKGKKEGFNAVNYYGDFVFLAIFLIEAIIKIIALGLILHAYSYLRSTVRVIFASRCCRKIFSEPDVVYF